MFKILIDTCVWLDLAKDYRRHAALGVIEELVSYGRVDIILPRTVVDEFARNRQRVTEESGRSLSRTLKSAKEAVNRLGDAKRKRIALQLLNDVDYKIPAELVKDKQKVTVRFQSTGGNETATVHGIRIITNK